MKTDPDNPGTAGATSSVAVQRRTKPPTTNRLPHAFVIFTLAALVAALFLIPKLLSPRINQAREKIIMADPVHGLADSLQIGLTREMAALRNYRDRRLDAELARYRELGREDERLLTYLLAVASQLGPGVVNAANDVRENVAKWHEHVTTVLHTTAPFDESIYTDALQAASDLDGVVREATFQREFDILNVEKLERTLTNTAVLLALIAALVVAWLGRRLRLVALEASRRRDEVERLMEAKAMLMHGITHDIKNPLGAIDGYAQLLEGGIKGELSGPQLESITRIRRNVKSSLAIIDNLLELARAETGQLQLAHEQVEVVQLTRDAVEDHRAELEHRGLEVQFLESDQPHQVITGDADRIRAILGNLLSNAGKYTPKGGHVIVTVATRSGGPAPRAGKFIALSVQDDGPGIPAQHAEFIFQEFARLESGTRRGAGLGLAISRKVARLMNGDLTVESRPGNGSIFTLWLPPTDAPERGESAVLQYAGGYAESGRAT